MANVKGLKVLEPTQRLRGTLPKIGIRPAIDGRRKGVRESLENQTMEMAKSAAKFFSGHLWHPNGLPVECVIADTCIGGVAEAAEAADKFARQGVGLSLTVSPCWCYGSETMDMDPLTPKAVWGFNGTERPGAVYLAAVLAGHNQKGLPAFGIYGKDVQDAGDTSIPKDVREKLLRFAKAGLAAAEMKGQVLPLTRLGFHGHCRLCGRCRFLPELPGNAQRVRGHVRIRAAHRGRNLRQRRIQARLRMGEERIAPRVRITTFRKWRAPRRMATGTRW